MPVLLPRPLLLALTFSTLASACPGSDAAERSATNGAPAGTAAVAEFDGAAAMGFVRKQLEFGPRVPGTPAHVAAGDWLAQELMARGAQVTQQRWTHVTADGRRLPMRNIFARFAPDAARRVLYVAHWDSRPHAEKGETDAQRAMPVPGANDGASGVAILLGVAEALQRKPATIGVDLLFTDGEDWGDFTTNTDVLIGAEYFAAHLPTPDYRPEFGVLWDMVGDEFPQFEIETNSLQAAPDVVQRVWGVAKRLGYEMAFPTREYGPITDDHLPLIRAGLKVIDVIDLNYPWHHTPDDTADKVSQRTLQMVGDVAMAVLRDF